MVVARKTMRKRSKKAILEVSKESESSEDGAELPEGGMFEMDLEDEGHAASSAANAPGGGESGVVRTNRSR